MESLRQLPEKDRASLLVQFLTTEIAVRTTTFSGPLPPPEAFGKYDTILPGAAERILSMAEKEQAMRGRDAGALIANDTKRINHATVVAFLLVCIAGLAVWKGMTPAAVILGSIGIVGSIARALFNWLARLHDLRDRNSS